MADRPRPPGDDGLGSGGPSDGGRPDGGRPDRGPRDPRDQRGSRPASPPRPGQPPQRGQGRPGLPANPRRPGPRDDRLMPSDYDGDFDYESAIEEAMAPPPPLLDRFKSRSLWRKVAIGVGILFVLWFLLHIRAQFDPGKPGEEVTVSIERGATLSSIADQLDKAGVIPSATAFKIWMKIDGEPPTVVAGEYRFHAHESPGAALEVLRSGPKQAKDRITVPEGRRLSQIADLVGQVPGLSSKKFMDLATSGQIRSEYEPDDSNNLEGLLFPDTYFLQQTDTEETLLRRMIATFENRVATLGIDKSDQTIGHTPYETITIASMIEAEAKTDEDRGKISTVIENRLFKGMPLQIDATVYYGIGNPSRGLTKKDLQTDGPYNTYTRKTLPVGPIDSPGLESLRAALSPTPGSWLYYVIAAPDGSHAFADTNEEHEANKAKARAQGLL